jgi:hypothetical protein
LRLFRSHRPNFLGFLDSERGIQSESDSSDSTCTSDSESDSGSSDSDSSDSDSSESEMSDLVSDNGIEQAEIAAQQDFIIDDVVDGHHVMDSSHKDLLFIEGIAHAFGAGKRDASLLSGETQSGKRQRIF